MSNGPYIPISCAFHDQLEMLATTHKPVRIVFHDAENSLQERTSSLVDVYAQGNSEYLRTRSGETIRLDWLVEVDGHRLANFQAQSSFCAV